MCNKFSTLRLTVYFLSFRKSAESEEGEKLLMRQLEKRLSAPAVEKDDDRLYGDLLTVNLRKLSSDCKLLAKHEIDNVMFKYLLAQRQQENSMQEPSVPPTPTLTPTEPLSPTNISAPVINKQSKLIVTTAAKCLHLWKSCI